MRASRSTPWLVPVAFTAIYVAAGKLGLHFAEVHTSATAVWPSTGIALAALLLFGARMWPAVAVGAFVVNLTTAGSIASSLGIAFGNTLEALVGAWLVDRFAGGRHAFDRPRDIFAFVGCVIPGTLLSASLGVTTLVLGNHARWSDFATIWTTWALGDITGALIFTPLVLLWADRRPVPFLERPFEAVCVLLSTVVAGLAVFGGLSPLWPERQPLSFLALPPLLWAALRLGRRAAVTTVLVLSAIALLGTVRGLGAFAGVSPGHSLLLLQAFMATMVVTTLLIAALVSARKREHTLLQAIIDHIPVMITLYEPSTRLLRLNREFERLTGWSTAEARQVDLMEHCYPDPAQREQARAFMASLEEGWRDIAMTTRDGRVIETSWSNVRLADDTRIGIGLDARERKRQETERERARADAEAANRAKDEFFAMLGHELRNPLGAISTALRVVESAGPLEARSLEARRIMSRQIVHLARLVDDLLDVTRLSTGKVAIEAASVDLAAVARRLAASVNRPIACHAPEAAWIHADETRLEQILLNLLNNAVKFTPADGHVEVAVANDSDEVVLRVADTGAGIPADLLPRVFDLFVQGPTGLHRREAGLGIGLTLVKRLVDLHGGRIDVASAGPGKGTVFTIRFARAASPAPVESPSTTASTGVRRRVLIVEDNDDSRQMLRYLLELLGHDVHEAEDGVAGVRQTLALRPDAVVIDIGLPGLDGYGAAREIRAAGLAEVTLIALTGYGQPEDRLRAIEAGFDAHVTKPVDPAELEALLGPDRLATKGPEPLPSS